MLSLFQSFHMFGFNMHDRSCRIFMALTWTEILRVPKLWLLSEVAFEDGDGLGESLGVLPYKVMKHWITETRNCVVNRRVAFKSLSKNRVKSADAMFSLRRARKREQGRETLSHDMDILDNLKYVAVHNPWSWGNSTMENACW